MGIPDFVVGDRVRLQKAVEVWMNFRAEKGLEGSVVMAEKWAKRDPATGELWRKPSALGYVAVRLDDTVDGLEPWDNELIFTLENSDSGEPECAGYTLEEALTKLDWKSAMYERISTIRKRASFHHRSKSGGQL